MNIHDSDWPLISVIIPTRDRPVLLRRAVQSVLSQDYPGPIECLIVFDQSEPANPEVAVPPGRILRLLRNERSPGLAGARNSGAFAAQGTYLAFLDDDDEWLPSKLRLQVEALRRYGHAKVSATGIVVCYGRRQVARIPPESGLVQWHLFWLSWLCCHLLVKYSGSACRRPTATLGGCFCIRKAIEHPLKSPVFGYGAPRPSEKNSNLPSVGTHSQFLLVLFSHGVPGLVFFVLWWLYAFFRTSDRLNVPDLWYHIVLLMVLVQFVYYELLPMQIHIAMIAAALALHRKRLAALALHYGTSLQRSNSIRTCFVASID